MYQDNPQMHVFNKIKELMEKKEKVSSMKEKKELTYLG